LIPFIQMWKEGIRLWPPRPVTGTIGAHVRRDLCPPAHTGGLFFTLDSCRARPTNPVRRGASLNARPATMEACGRNPVGGRASTRDKVQLCLVKLGIALTNGQDPGVKLVRSRKSRL